MMLRWLLELMKIWKPTNDPDILLQTREWFPPVRALTANANQRALMITKLKKAFQGSRPKHSLRLRAFKFKRLSKNVVFYKQSSSYVKWKMKLIIGLHHQPCQEIGAMTRRGCVDASTRRAADERYKLDMGMII